MAALSENTRFVVIGGGKMGEAILGGLIASEEAPADVLSGKSFFVADPGQERRDYLEQTYGVTCFQDGAQIQDADIVLLSVKPQVMMAVLDSLSAVSGYQGGKEGPLFVSIAAGLSTQRLESALPEGARLVRCMPNTPLLVSKGAVAVTAGSKATQEDVDLVHGLFACLGKACIIPEDQMDAICALSGSGPAYVAHLVELMRDAGVEQGLDPQLAEEMALQTVYGTAALMVEKNQSPEVTRISVCSPGGTTLAALDAMTEAGFAKVISAGVEAAVVRGKELGKL